jgi:hypothetical protein
VKKVSPAGKSVSNHDFGYESPQYEDLHKQMIKSHAFLAMVKEAGRCPNAAPKSVACSLCMYVCMYVCIV